MHLECVTHDGPQDIARAILAGFDKHYRLFRAISAGAKERFEAGDWAAVRSANRERIDMYDLRVREGVATLRQFPRVHDESLWPAIKHAYVALLLEHQQPELAETFFNSVASRVLARTYYNNQHIFWRRAVSTEHIESLRPTYNVYYPAELGLRATLKALFIDAQLLCPWEDLERDLHALLHVVSELLPKPREVTQSLQVHVLSSLFYRNRSAYLVGRLDTGTVELPFAVPIRKNSKGELYLDGALAGQEQLGTLFSLARAYFMVDMEVPSGFIAFLKTLFPSKPAAELYIALGLQKQGKTEFYRDLFEHLRHSSDRFVVAPGVKGMVMVVFTLPSFPYVFKVIRDHFEPPKDVDRKKVMEQYLVVKYHDRVGRLADALEYSQVALPTTRLDPSLLAELKQLAPSQLELDADKLVLKHVYIERRMVPLDVWLHGADDAKLKHGLFEFGQAVRELAGANIFPGDLLLKNFGVTRAGRVVFYDYDELAKVTDCTFRKLPTARDDEEDWSGEPWFFVGAHDIFPEELPKFLFNTDKARALFLSMHGDLATAEFWQQKQEQLGRGVEDDVMPYPEARRFPHQHP
ncbi:MAG: bifunctional isocitrate dehydrogenase kinase/phosphatase [Archangium sp.]|nr:bifunctional isocitrate dehydrogenase kinase/phosphatase [Archangium sp.]MDP3573452.1 bifunctional isocitrate dehydrogenase kinase/phosphatase [Archangium sp.]